MANQIKVFIEGEVLVLDHFSGIGHYTAALLKEVDELLETDEYSHLQIEIGLPRMLAKRIKRFGYKNFKYRNMWVSPRISNTLKRYNLAPPLDMIYGKKVYVFPHFSSWPTKSSPQIPIIYDLSFEHFPEYSSDENRRFLSAQTKLSAKRATRIVTISNNSKREISEYYGVPPEMIDVVVPVLDKERFKPQSLSATRKVRAKYAIFDEYILFVGNIEPRKNLVTLLKAYRKLPKDLQDRYALLLVGAKGWKDGEIHDLISEMREEGIKVLQPSGYVSDEDLPALYSAAKAFAYVSIYEGYGIPPTEAMACLTPVISSNNSSLPEAVEDAAIMVNALDEDKIAKAIEDILTDENLAENLIEKGRARVGRLDARGSAITFLNSIIKSGEAD